MTSQVKISTSAPSQAKFQPPPNFYFLLEMCIYLARCTRDGTQWGIFRHSQGTRGVCDSDEMFSVGLQRHLTSV